MSSGDLARAMVELGRQTILLLGHLLHRYWFSVLVAAVALSVFMSSWAWLRERRVVTYTLLDGPAGGTGRGLGEQVAGQVRDSSRVLGMEYVIQTVHTNGYAENQRRISQDTSGRLLGFAHDGFGDPSAIRVILPLERTYLHILARRGFLEELKLWPPEQDVPLNGAARDKPPAAVKLSAVIAKNKLQPGRVFFGPKGSGTQEAAHVVFQHYDLHPQLYQTHGVADWHDMRAAFNTGAIDLAFYSGPIGSDAVANIAKDDSAVLLDLGSDAETILQTASHMTSASIVANSYRHDGAFCCSKINTLSFRRVLIASRRMSDSDAFFLAGASKEALRPHLRGSELDDPKTDPDVAIAQLAKRLRFPAHPGAVMALEGKTYSYLPQGVMYFLATLALAVVVEFARYVASELSKRGRVSSGGGELAAGIPPTPPSPEGDEAAAATSVAGAREVAIAEGPSRYGALYEELDDLVLEIETTAPDALTTELRSGLAGRLRKIRQQVLECHSAGQLTLGQRDSLLAGTHEALYQLRAAAGESPPASPTGTGPAAQRERGPAARRGRGQRSP
jgi:hypothetical protein